MYFYFLFFKFVPRILFMRRITFGGDSDAGRAFVPQGKKGAGRLVFTIFLLLKRQKAALKKSNIWP
jgi:hypothetical protein